MEHRILGRTGLMVSAIGFGAWAIGGNAYGNSYGPTEDRWSKVAFSRALGLGCTLVDTADVYGHGHSERLIGSITNCRQDIIIVTKGGLNFYNHDVHPSVVPQLEAGLGRSLSDFLPDAVLSVVHGPNFTESYLRFALENSRQRLREDTIPVYLLYNPPLAEIKSGRVFDILDKFKAEGLIHIYGVSIHEPEEGVAAIEDGRPDVIQVTYNLLNREPARRALLDLAGEKNIGVIVCEPLANGLLTGKFRGDERFPEGDRRGNFPPDYFYYRAEAARQLDFLVKPDRSLAQAAILFALSHPAVSTVAVGCKTREQVVENFGALQSPPLTKEELALIDEVVLV